MELKTLRTKWLAPLVFFEIYLTLTVLLFFFGPWPWDTKSPTLLALYLGGAQLFIGAGYLLAWRSIRLSPARTDENSCKTQEIAAGILFLKRGLVITFSLLIPTSLSRTGYLFPNVIDGITDPGSVYNISNARLEGGNPFLIVEYLRILLSPFLIGIYPLAVVYWSRLTRKVKLACVISIIFNLCFYIATGTNKGIADFLITLPWMVFLGAATGVLKLRVNRGFLICGLVVLFVIFMIFFGAGQAQREGGVGVRGVFNTGSDLISADRSSFVSSMLSNNLQIIFESITRYIGQGYYALSMSFGIDHSSTLGFGSSMFLARNANAIFGTDYFTANSIPGLLENQTGWGMLTLWHSIYPWLASDFGFVGALFVLAILAYLFSLNWGKSLLTLAPRRIILSYLLLILFYYIPANNQIFQSGEGCIAFIILLFGPNFSRKVRVVGPAVIS